METESENKKKDTPGKKKPVYLYPLLGGLFLLLIIGSVFLVIQFQSVTKDDARNRPVHVLMLGNDLMVTNDLPDILRQMFSASYKKRKIEISSIALPDSGYDTGKHLNSQSLNDLLKVKPNWDFVVVQDGADQIIDHPYEVLSNIRKLQEKISGGKARFVLLMPWVEKGSRTKQAVLSAISSKLAKNLSLRVAPVGDAFIEIQNKYPDIDLLMDDDRQASGNGSWVASAAIFSALTGRELGPTQAKVFYRYGSDKKTPVQLVGSQLDGICRIIWAQIGMNNRGHRLSLVPETRGAPGLVPYDKGK